jgi:hypothetical protein
MTSPQGFARGGALLAKDLRLLGEVLGEDDQAFEQLRNASAPFLDEALEKH